MTLKEGRSRSMEGDMTGQRPLGEDYEILGRGALLEERTIFSVFSVGYFSSLGVWVDCYRGAPGC